MKIPFYSLEYMHKEIYAEIQYAFQQVYESNWFILGKAVEKFEEEYAAFTGVKYCAGVSNCLDGLALALQVLNIGEGDEVIVPSNTYIATVLAISQVGATPIFAEPNIETYNIEAAAIEEKITARTKAVMPVHLYGQSCRMDEIIQLAEKNNLYVIEDNAQSHGSRCKEKITGSWGHINATSFYPGKNLGALGDAGAITTDNKEWVNKIKMLRNYGSSKKYYNDEAGYNMRLDELQAAFLSVKLKHLSAWNAERQRLAALYQLLLKEVEEIKLPVTDETCTHVYHLFIIRTKRRDELQQYSQAHEIGTLIHYPLPPHLQKAYSHLGYKKNDFPVAEELADTMLSLPLYPGMTEEQVTEVCDAIKKFFRKI